MTDSCTIFGQTLKLRRYDDQAGHLYSSEFLDDMMTISATHRISGWCIVVTCDGVQCVGPHKQTTDYAEGAWLEKASLETPRLANRVLDLIEAAK